MFKNNAGAECDRCIFLTFDGQVELCFFGFCACLENGNVVGLLFALILYFGLVQFIIDFEVASGQDLEDGITIVLKVQDIVKSLILGFDIGESFGSEKTKIVVFFLVTLYQNTLTKAEVRVVIVF